jgi:formylglycine-generating enzyme required for sulfatase activity
MSIVGSPPYMSPEQWKGEGVDHRTDVYALAVLLFQMLCGQLPYQADSMPVMMYQHLSGTLPKAESLGVTLMPEIEAVLQKGLEKEPSDRYDSMEIMLADLEQAASGQFSKKMLTGEETAVLMPTGSIGNIATKPPSGDTDDRAKKFAELFDSTEKPAFSDDPKRAQELLDAQDKIALAKTEAINADALVQELVEAQKRAEEAQDKALQAKQRIEADVRRQVEAEMSRLESEAQAKHEAKAQELSDEVEARRVAEERANFMAQAALQAQQLAEEERKRRQEEAEKRELHERDRKEAEIAAQQLAEQVAEAKRQYEAAKADAEREAKFRAEVEAKQQKLEGELQSIAANESEQRRILEEKAKKYINEQAEKFEREAADAQKRLEEAAALIDFEAQKREQAEAARLQAEEEASRLSKEIVEVHRQMQEMQQHLTSDSQSRSINSLGASSPSVITVGSGQTSLSSNSVLLNAQGGPNRKALAAFIGGSILLIIFAVAGIGLYVFVKRSPGPVANNATPVPAKKSALKQVRIQGGPIMMGRNDISDKKDDDWGNQYPAHPETVSDYDIDVTETSNAEYAEFIKETSFSRSPWPNGKVPAGQENLPVVNVRQTDAEAYAAWVSTRENRKCHLPTEVQWEYAARNGSEMTTYPWGNEPQLERAILKGKPAAVGTSNDKTNSGLMDMLGNVSEWTSTQYALYPNHPFPLKLDEKEVYVIRGMSFLSPNKNLSKPELLLTTRKSRLVSESFEWVGFRLACEP